MPFHPALFLVTRRNLPCSNTCEYLHQSCSLSHTWDHFCLQSCVRSSLTTGAGLSKISTTSKFLLSEHSRDEGRLKVFAQECYHEEIHETITKFIEAVRSDLWEETFKCSLSKRSDDVKMVIGRGGCIQHILMPGDFQKVVVRGLSEYSIPHAKEILESIGKCSFKTIEFERETQLIVSFKDLAHAAKTLKPGFTDAFIPGATIQQHIERHDNDFCLRVSWKRRERQDHAWVNFPENVSLEKKLKKTFWRDRSGLSFTVSSSIDKNSIKVNGIRENTTEDQIKAPLFKEEFNDQDMDIHFCYSPRPFDQSYLTEIIWIDSWPSLPLKTVTTFCSTVLSREIFNTKQLSISEIL